MNINASIIDQRVNSIVHKYESLFPEGQDINHKKSTAFLLLCMSTMFECEIEEAAEFLTDGGNDASVDGVHVGELQDGEFTVTLFQSKYKQNLEGQSNFPENDVKKIINSVGSLFDPDKKVHLNKNVQVKIEEIRSLVRDGYIPYVQVVLCNNGEKWTENAQTIIDNAKFGPQVEWIHINHDKIISILQSKKEVKETLVLTGKAVIEDFNFRRVLIGKIPVEEIKRLFDNHGDRLLERNIRRYLGLNNNRVNLAIKETLTDKDKRSDFYFFNNGITMICNKFRYNALQSENYQVQVEGMEIVNGGQTCRTIQKTLSEDSILYDENFQNVFVMLRLYELSEDDQDFIYDITYATNNQNPVDLRDLHSNDEIQRKLEMSLLELGYVYKRHREESKRLREEGISGSEVITTWVAASAILSIWRKLPHLAKFRSSDHFGKLYKIIFSDDLNSAQLIIAVLILRFVENERKRPSILSDLPDFVPYASYFIAMLIGKRLLDCLKLSLGEVNPNNFNEIKQIFEKNKENYYCFALDETRNALDELYGQNKEISLQRLSATFRRGDLLEQLHKT